MSCRETQPAGKKRKAVPDNLSSSSDGSDSSDDDLPLSVKDLSSLKDVKHLDWRADPEESHSDWTVEVLVHGKIHGTYHVHKSILSVGSKQSMYFARLFQNKTLHEHATNTSRIELEPLAANAFSDLLDYLYAWNDTPKINHENAAALHHLGNYLEIPRLRIQARLFWEAHMSMEHCAQYCAHAKLFRDKTLLSAVAQKCSEPSTFREGLIIEQDPSCLELIRVSDEQLWLKALKKNKGKPNPSLSLLVAMFVDHHHHVAKDLSADSFAKLTRNELLPEICWKAALRFLKVDHAMAVRPSLSSSSENKTQNNDGGDDDDDELSSLQEQCIDVLVSSWQDLDSTNVTKTLRKLSPVILSEVLTRLVKQTKRQQHLMPSSIIVIGAGTEAVNGVYVRTGDLQCNAPCFAMRAHWNGLPGEFKMDLSRLTGGANDTRVYYLWRISVDPSNGNGGEIHFYWRHVNENDSKLPPMSGWQPWWEYANSGPSVRPSPQLKYSYDYGAY